MINIEFLFLPLNFGEFDRLRFFENNGRIWQHIGKGSKIFGYGGAKFNGNVRNVIIKSSVTRTSYRMSLRCSDYGIKERRFL
jgi:hypothetical protein